MTLNLSLAVFNTFTLRKGSYRVATLNSKGSKSGQAGRNAGFFFYWQGFWRLQYVMTDFPVIPSIDG